MATERRHAGLSRSVLALLRRIFQRCQGKPVNKLSRQMTPEEAVELHARMRAHGIPEKDEHETPNPRTAKWPR